MSYSEEKAKKLEQEVPEKAAKAFRAAYRRSLNSGNSVLIAEHGKLIEVSPDLRKRVIRTVDGPKKVVSGTVYKLVRPDTSIS